MASERAKALRTRQLEFAILIAAVLFGIGILVTGPAGQGSIFGFPNRALFACAGLMLLVAVVFSASKFLFSNLPAEVPADDAVSKSEGAASARVIGGIVEAKYSGRAKSANDPSLEDYYGFGKK